MTPTADSVVTASVRSQETTSIRDIRITDALPSADWDAYLDRTGGGAVFHRSGWDNVFSAYGLPVVRLAIVRKERIVGVLPLVRQRSLVFGDRLVSLPWFDSAGILADSDEDRARLIDAAIRKAGTLGVREIEIRQSAPLDLSPHVRTDKVLMRLPLEPDPDVLWDRLKAKVRNQVRKGEKSGLMATSGGAELLPEFFAVYSRNMRDLGSPSHSAAFFEAVLRAFPNAARVHVVRLEARAVGAGLTIANGDATEIPWASSLREFNGLCVNHFMYWNLLQDACRSGFRWFHFGRSTRDSGTYQFKRQWGAEEVPLHWYHFGPGAADTAAKPSQESFGWAVAAWRKLPLWATRRIGPRVISKVA